MINNFLKEITGVYKTGSATEHSYRAALQNLFTNLDAGITAINEPKRIACGAPDFIFQRGELAVGHLEAKDLHLSLRGMKDANKAQQERYLKALPNLIYTNCLDWDFYRNGELFASINLAVLEAGTLIPIKGNLAKLEELLTDFLNQRPQNIASPEALAKIMAGKAQLIKNVFATTLNAKDGQQSDLYGHYLAFKQQLLHNITIDEFADIYAETLAYGMFAARLHDTTPDNFSRQEALELLPKTNPFLRNLFSFIAGPNLDERIAWVVDDLAAVFLAADISKILTGFGKLTGRKDPFLHFYETFLAEYNPAKRKARGVWYTPEAVVNFIVRAVDEVLINEFGLADGLADTSKIEVNWDTDLNDKRGKPILEKRLIHRVQILDPATGTGTFLAEVIKQIAPKIKNLAPSMWSPYIETDLIPRLHGFELLMASYSMCHMKLDMILTELGYTPSENPPRLSVYLTNSLEEGEREVQDLFMAQWLTREARQANDIKRKNPIMCIIGNPPYAGISTNNSPWILNLIDDYKKEPNSKLNLQERKHRLNDDYVKFIRMSEHLISKNGEGILGFITNHGYIDNPTFRGMRWKLMNTFNKIYILDLHGNSKKKEATPEGKPDINIFDIQQGVSIIIAIKNKNDSSLAEVFHSDLWGDRESKYSELQASGINDINWKKIKPAQPNYLFVPTSSKALEENYNKHFSIIDLMPLSSSGIQSSGDRFALANDRETIEHRLDYLQKNPTSEQLKSGYNLGNNYINLLLKNIEEFKNTPRKNIVPVTYRPFDIKHTLFSNKFLWRPRTNTLKHMLRDNLALVIGRQGHVVGDMQWNICFISNNISDLNLFYRGGGLAFPLYLYPDDNSEKIVNFDPRLHKKLLKLSKHQEKGEPSELHIFDYIYAILHNPTYRETYAEFLKYDFPRIPFPTSPEEFWQLAKQGEELRHLHLMQPTAIGETPYPLVGEGDNTINQPKLKNNQIWINKTQYFDQIPEGVWEFYIGGYQPAQKWLKDRRNEQLNFAQLRHYQQIIKILARTQEIMQKITLEL